MLYETLLEQIGLTKGEIKVYLTLLKLGQTTTGKVIENANISSGKIYEILDKLIKKGLVSFIIQEKTKYFQAADPTRILDYMEEIERKHRKQQEELRRILPELKTLQIKPEKRYEVTIYKGIRGMQTAAYETLRSLKKGDEFLAMGVLSEKKEVINRMWRNWHKERIGKKILCKMIFTNIEGEHYKLIRKMQYVQIKVLKGITPTAVDIAGDKTMIFTSVEPSCIVITGEEVAQSFRQFFYTLWKIANR